MRECYYLNFSEEICVQFLTLIKERGLITPSLQIGKEELKIELLRIIIQLFQSCFPYENVASKKKMDYWKNIIDFLRLNNIYDLYSIDNWKKILSLFPSSSLTLPELFLPLTTSELVDNEVHVPIFVHHPILGDGACLFRATASVLLHKLTGFTFFEGLPLRSEFHSSSKLGKRSDLLLHHFTRWIKLYVFLFIYTDVELVDEHLGVILNIFDEGIEYHSYESNFHIGKSVVGSMKLLPLNDFVDFVKTTYHNPIDEPIPLKYVAPDFSNFQPIVKNHVREDKKMVYLSGEGQWTAIPMLNIITYDKPNDFIKPEYWGSLDQLIVFSGLFATSRKCRAIGLQEIVVFKSPPNKNSASSSKVLIPSSRKLVEVLESPKDFHYCCNQLTLFYKNANHYEALYVIQKK